MKFAWKKAMALGLCLCMALGLLLPAAGSADAAEYDFPEVGSPTYLGEHITGRTMRELADHISYGGEDYILLPLYGGKLYIFRLSEYLRGEALDSWVYDVEETGFTIPGNIDSYTYGTTPKVFVSGGTSSLAIYSFSPSNSSATTEIETYQLSTKATINALSIDSFGNVFLAAAYGSKGQVYRLTWDGSSKTFSETLLYETADVTDMSTIVTGDRASDDYIYVQGTLPGGKSSNIYKIHYTAGSKNPVTSVQYSKTTDLFYLSSVGNMLLGGTSGSNAPGDGFICVDTATMTKSSITIIKNGEAVTGSHLIGAATEPENGVSYMNISGVGLCEYDIATNTATYLKNLSPAIRVRALYHYNNNPYLMTMANSGAPYLITLNGSPNLGSITSIVEEGVSNWIARTIGAGVPGAGPAAYVGGYITTKVASFDPKADTPLNHSLFSHSVSQTDAILPYQGKLYLGCYSGAHLVEYDPNTGAVTELIPGLYNDYSQLRIHALAAGDNKIFFATIPGVGLLGGCIGWYDLSNNTWYCERNVVAEQSVIALAYDEDSDILYCGTTVRGGTSTTPTAKEAVVMAYDVNAKKVLDTTTVSALTGDYPDNISGLAQDPSTGKIWGLVSHTIFSVSYKNGALSVTKEWAADTVPSVPYTNSGGMNWFPKAILFDSNGDMYLSLNQNKYGIMKFTLDANRKIQNAKTIAPEATRIYNMGSDGNIYYAISYDLYRVSLNRVSIAEDLIYTANADDASSIATAENAYNSLSDAEQAEVGSYYYKKLRTLSGEECLVNGVNYMTLQDAMATAGSGDTVKLLVSQIGDITLANGVTLDLGGKTVTGNVTVTNGALDLNGGSIAGDLTVVNGTVADATNGKAGITGRVELQQNNSGYLPLLDGEVTRFFVYEATALASGCDRDRINQVNFWFDLRFTNQKAYTLLASGDATNLRVWAELYVDGRKIDADVVFDTKLMEWAGQDHTGEDNWALYVGVTNMPSKAKTVTIKPCLSANGMTVSMGELTHTVKLPTGQALFGAYPTDLIK